MSAINRPRVDPYRLYLGLQVGMAFLNALAFTTVVVYWVQGAKLSPLQLLIQGTVLEVVYFLLQIPTGLLADLTGRRRCIIAGILVSAASLLLQGASPAFSNLVTAQAVMAVGASLMNGAEAAWAAAEIGSAQMTTVYLKATRLSFIGMIAGSLLSGLIASATLRAPLLLSGALMTVGGLTLAWLMPETGFQSRATHRESWHVALTQSRKELREQLRTLARTPRLVPGMPALLSATFLIGLWSESFDRLSGAYLLREVTFPHILGIEPPLWFSLIGCTSAAFGILSSTWANRRGEHGAMSFLAASTLLTAAGVTALTSTTTFPLAVLLLITVSAMRPLYTPIANGWIIARIDPQIRATALSAHDMFDSGGQITSGPLIGLIGSMTSIRIALLTGAAALAPAALMLSRLRFRKPAARSTDPKP